MPHEGGGEYPRGQVFLRFDDVPGLEELAPGDEATVTMRVRKSEDAMVMAGGEAAGGADFEIVSAAADRDATRPVGSSRGQVRPKMAPPSLEEPEY